MATITRVGNAVYQNTGTAQVPVSNPAGAASDDKMLLVITSSANAVSITTLSGWTLLLDATYNARRTFVLTRDYAASYPNIVLSGSATAGSAIVAVRAATGYTLTAPTIGTKWDRPSNGGSQVTTLMPSMTGAEDGLTIGITAETSTGEETESGVTFAGTGWTKWFYGDTNPSLAVAVVYWFGYKDLDGAVASENVTTTWPNSSTNSMGVQVTFGQTSNAPVSGIIEAAGVYGQGTGHIVVGGRVKNGATDVVVMIGQGGFWSRETSVTMGTNGRFNAYIDLLNAGQDYEFGFKVDNVEQTDVYLEATTLTLSTHSFTAVAGSCLFTGSTHPVFDRIMDHNPETVSIQGDLHYEDSDTAAGWWAGMVASLNAMRGLSRKVAVRWTPDNHDTIRTTPLGGGAPELPPIWKQVASNYASGMWASDDTVGQAWRSGRVLFIQPDMRSARDNYATNPAPLDLLGTEQREWLTNLFDEAESDTSIALVVWYSSWIGLQQGSGRFGSYPEEYAALKAVIDARPRLKSRLVMVAGDTHNIWADSGARAWPEAAFPGVPSLNASGYNRASPAETFFIPDIANLNIQTSGVEADWGAYSLLTFTEIAGGLEFRWDAKRVNAAGVEDTPATWSRTYMDDTPSNQPWSSIHVGNTEATAVYVGTTKVWP